MQKRNVRNYEQHGEFTYGLDDERAKPNTGWSLNKEFKLGAEDCHYHIDGAWYPEPSGFPLVLFDRFGYIYMQSYDNYLKIVRSKDYRKNEGQLHINVGIHTCSEYVLYPHTPKTFNDGDNIRVQHLRKISLEKEDNRKKKTIELRDIMLKMLNGQSSLIKEKLL